LNRFNAGVPGPRSSDKKAHLSDEKKIEHTSVQSSPKEPTQPQPPEVRNSPLKKTCSETTQPQPPEVQNSPLKKTFSLLKKSAEVSRNTQSSLFDNKSTATQQNSHKAGDINFAHSSQESSENSSHNETIAINEVLPLQLQTAVEEAILETQQPDIQFASQTPSISNFVPKRSEITNSSGEQVAPMGSSNEYPSSPTKEQQERDSPHSLTPVQANKPKIVGKNPEKTADLAYEKVHSDAVEEEEERSTTKRSVASSGWSWTGSAVSSLGEPSDDDEKGEAASEAEEQPEKVFNQQNSPAHAQDQPQYIAQETQNIHQMGSSADDFTDEEVKSLASELEELKALVEAVGREEDECSQDMQTMPPRDIDKQSTIIDSESSHAAGVLQQDVDTSHIISKNSSLPEEALRSIDRTREDDILRVNHTPSSSGEKMLDDDFQDGVPLNSSSNSAPSTDQNLGNGEKKVLVEKEAEISETSSSKISSSIINIHSSSAAGDPSSGSEVETAVAEHKSEQNKLQEVSSEQLDGLEKDDSSRSSYYSEVLDEEDPNQDIKAEPAELFRSRQSELTLPIANFGEISINTINTDDGDIDDRADSEDASLDLQRLSDSTSDKMRQTSSFSNVDTPKNIAAPDTHQNRASEPDAPSPRTPTSEPTISAAPFTVDNVLKTWKENPSDPAVDPTLFNCYGAFHIRVLRAQRLPCPVGSTVQASVSLLPWKGRFRTERRTTFVLDQENSTSFDHGVCAQWDDVKGDPSTTVSLIHAYASEATPIPTIKIRLLLTPVKMLDFSMCSLALPCDVLMRNPGNWMRQWFLAEMQESKKDDASQLFSDEQTAMVEIEAMFAPDDQSFGSSFVSIGRRPSANALEFEDFSARGGESRLEAESFAGSNSVKQDDGTTVVAQTKPHLLRVTKFWKPAACALCSSSLMGWRAKSFRCEACGLDCCSDCRLHVDVQLPCGSTKALEAVEKLIQNKLTVSKFLETMAPVDETYEQKKRDLSLGPQDDISTLAAETKTEAETVARGERGRMGVLKLSVVRACVFQMALPAVTDPEELLHHKGELQPGDYYVRVCRTGSEGSARTRTIPSAGRLKFEESHEMKLDV
jgi:hypothetical protein